MSDRETLDAIAQLIDADGRPAGYRDAEEALAEIGKLIKARDAERESKQYTRATWATEVRAAAEVARDLPGHVDFNRRLELLLETAASFVEHGSDLGGGLMPYRFKSLAQAVYQQAEHGVIRRRVLIDAADALRDAGEALFDTAGAPSSRPVFQAEDTLRAVFALPDSDAAPVSAPEKKE